MNRAEQKYAGLHDLTSIGQVRVVTVEQNTVSVMGWSASGTRSRIAPCDRSSGGISSWRAERSVSQRGMASSRARPG